MKRTWKKQLKLNFFFLWGGGGLVRVLKKIGFGFSVCVCVCVCVFVFVFCCFLRMFTLGEVFRFAGALGGREEDGRLMVRWMKSYYSQVMP